MRQGERSDARRGAARRVSSRRIKDAPRSTKPDDKEFWPPILINVNDTPPQPGDQPVVGRDPHSKTVPIDLGVTRQLLATAAGTEDPTFRTLIDGLSGQEKAIDAILEEVLGDPARLAAVEATGLLDGTPKPILDHIVTLTAEAVGTRNAAVTVVTNEQQILAGCTNASKGVDRAAPLEDSICKFAVATGQPLIVDDAARHPLLSDHPKVVDGTIRAYAGILLADGEGHAVGTLCTWDDNPRRWTSGQIQILNDLAQVVRTKVFGSLAREQPKPPQSTSSIFATNRRRRRL